MARSDGMTLFFAVSLDCRRSGCESKLRVKGETKMEFQLYAILRSSAFGIGFGPAWTNSVGFP